MIEKIHIPGLHNAEFSQFMNDVLSIVENYGGAAELDVVKPEAGLRKLVEEADALFKSQTGFKGTEKLAELDRRRDKTISGLNQVAAGMTNHPDDAIAQHAVTLEKHLKHYGGGAAARKNYAAETAIIKSILKDWANDPDLKAAIAALGLEVWEAALKSENDAFNEQYLLRNTEMSNASEETLRSKRIEAGEAYITLCNHLNSHFVLKEGAEPYNKIVKEFNALLGQYNAVLTSRKGRSDGEEEDAETEPTTEPDASGEE